MSGHKALGRGLDALFASTKSKVATPETNTQMAPVSGNEVREISVDKIKPNRHQPRTNFEHEALQELADSIKTHGLAQPILVTETGVPGEYELVAGERRLRASKLAGLSVIPCTIKKLSNRERFEVALIENIQRQDLNPLEEAVAFDGIMKEYSLTQDQLATAIGKSRSAVANILRLLRLHVDVQSALRSGTISEGHAKCLAGLLDQNEQLKWLEKVITGNLSVRELETLISGQKAQSKGGAIVKKAAMKLPEVQKFEDDFQRLLGRKVEIQSDGKKGWVKFAFYTPLDLEVLCQRLGLLPKTSEPEEENP
ncbi:MAG: ParB/RepB/Spo0J family partition protein [Elusimicrobiota bacterium]